MCTQRRLAMPQYVHTQSRTCKLVVTKLLDKSLFSPQLAGRDYTQLEGTAQIITVIVSDLLCFCSPLTRTLRSRDLVEPINEEPGSHVTPLDQ